MIFGSASPSFSVATLASDTMLMILLSSGVHFQTLFGRKMRIDSFHRTEASLFARLISSAALLYLARNWASTSRPARIDEEAASGGSQDYSIAIGGGSLSILPLDIKRYQVKPGDSLSEIAYRF